MLLELLSLLVLMLYLRVSSSRFPIGEGLMCKRNAFIIIVRLAVSHNINQSPVVF